MKTTWKQAHKHARLCGMVDGIPTPVQHVKGLRRLAYPVYHPLDMDKQLNAGDYVNAQFCRFLSDAFGIDYVVLMPK